MAGGTVLGLVATNGKAGGLYDGYGYGGYKPYAESNSRNGAGASPKPEPVGPA